ncbi:hypothetical protein [Actinoplanes philippinensis]|uniref:hypothetical protein n=1 Tax=Actinoplanes philippinensis TaxID=35752 RepID=UPI0033DDDA98
MTQSVRGHLDHRYGEVFDRLAGKTSIDGPGAQQGAQGAELSDVVQRHVTVDVRGRGSHRRVVPFGQVALRRQMVR